VDYQNGVGRDLLLEAPPNLGARDTRQNLQASLASLAMDKTRPISFEIIKAILVSPSLAKRETKMSGST
jgi:hypothetical protein